MYIYIHVPNYWCKHPLTMAPSNQDSLSLTSNLLYNKCTFMNATFVPPKSHGYLHVHVSVQALNLVGVVRVSDEDVHSLLYTS